MKNTVRALISEGFPSLLVRGLKIMLHETRKVWWVSLVLLELLVDIPDVCIEGQRGSRVIQEMVKMGTIGGVSVKMVVCVGTMDMFKGKGTSCNHRQHCECGFAVWNGWDDKFWRQHN